MVWNYVVARLIDGEELSLSIIFADNRELRKELMQSGDIFDIAEGSVAQSVNLFDIFQSKGEQKLYALVECLDSDFFDADIRENEKDGNVKKKRLKIVTLATNEEDLGAKLQELELKFIEKFFEKLNDGKYGEDEKYEWYNNEIVSKYGKQYIVQIVEH